MKLKPHFFSILISFICLSGNLTAQDEPVKNGIPPSTISDYETGDYLDFPKTGPVEIEVVDIAIDAVKPVREKRYYDEPFQFWPPSTDTILHEDYNIHLQMQKAKLKNYSTGNFPDLKKPVIKSVNELCYVLENNKKDTIRYYGDGWNERFEYDPNGNLTNLYVIFKDEKTNRDSAYLTTKYLYEGKKLKFKEFFWWATGDKEGEEELEYDETGKLFKVYYMSLDTDGNEIIEEGRGYRTLYKYEKDLEIEENYERLEDAMNEYVLEGIIYKKLNSDGNIIEKRYTDWPQKAPYNIYHYKYDSKGNEIFSGDESSFYTYTYNQNDDVETSVFKTENWSRTTTYRYQHDKHNNWITKEETEVEKNSDGTTTESVFLWKRELVYHDIK